MQGRGDGVGCGVDGAGPRMENVRGLCSFGQFYSGGTSERKPLSAEKVSGPRDFPDSPAAAACSPRLSRALQSGPACGWSPRRSLTRYSFGPRPSSQSCSLVSHCTSSPKRLRRGRQVCTSSTRSGFARNSLAANPPASQCHATHLYLVLLRQVLAGERRAKAPIHVTA